MLGTMHTKIAKQHLYSFLSNAGIFFTSILYVKKYANNADVYKQTAFER